MEENHKLFWEAIDKVQEGDLQQDAGNILTVQKAAELSVWLHTEFQCKMEEADNLMDMEAADETKPFDEKYKARELLQNLKSNEYLSDKYTKLPQAAENLSDNNSDASVSQGSDIMRCALGLIMHKLGVNFYDSEESTNAIEYLKKSLELMDSLPD